MVNREKRIFYINGDIEDANVSSICFNLLSMIKDDDYNESLTGRHVRKPIHLYIQSYGGVIDDMWTLIDIMLKSKTPIYTYCTGYAMSAAFKIFLAGDKRFIGKYARLMYHELSGMAFGKAQSIKDEIKEMSKMQERIEDYVVSRTKITKNQLKEIAHQRREWYIYPEEAIELGIAHEII